MTKDLPPHSEALVELTDYATVRRYQEGNEIITDDDISATIEAAKAVLAWAQTEIDRQLRNGTVDVRGVT